jgi:hypothetical protein
VAVWRNCAASMKLLEAVNARWPDRSRASDGTIGDPAHSSRTSDHNPNTAGVVRARDITAAGIDAAWLAEHLRRAGAAGDKRLTTGGYIIYNRRITRPDFTSWVAYTGSNPHTSHIHVSFSRDPGGYDSTRPWVFHDPVVDGLPVLRYGDRSDAVRRLQEFANRVFPTYAHLDVDGIYGDQVKAWVREFQRRAPVHGSPLDGSVVGPATNYELAKYGYRG